MAPSAQAHEHHQETRKREERCGFNRQGFGRRRQPQEGCQAWSSHGQVVSRQSALLLFLPQASARTAPTGALATKVNPVRRCPCRAQSPAAVPETLRRCRTRPATLKAGSLGLMCCMAATVGGFGADVWAKGRIRTEIADMAYSLQELFSKNHAKSCRRAVPRPRLGTWSRQAVGIGERHKVSHALQALRRTFRARAVSALGLR